MNFLPDHGLQIWLCYSQLIHLCGKETSPWLGMVRGAKRIIPGSVGIWEIASRQLNFRRPPRYFLLSQTNAGTPTDTLLLAVTVLDEEERLVWLVRPMGHV